MATLKVLGTEPFPGLAASVPHIRRYVRTAVAKHGSVIADIAELLASEIATNSLVHSRSGRPGGRILVTVADGDRTIRVQVRDQGGGSAVPHVRAAADPIAEHGHGLLLVKRLAARWGAQRTDDGGTITWFEVACDGVADHT
jgi:anti-sigma regulatory factor (Ser/Thr protein kinase)